MPGKHIRILACGALVFTAACADDLSGPASGEPPLVRSSDPASAQPALFTLVATPVLAAEQQGVLSSIRSRPFSAEVHVALLASAPALLLQLGNSVVLDVSPTTRFVAVGDKVSQRGPLDISWTGQFQKEVGSAQLVLTSKGVVGTIRTSTSLYEVMTIGGGLHAIVRVDEAKVPPEGQPGDPTPAPNVAFRSAEGGGPGMSAASFSAPLSGTPSFATASSNTIDTDIDVLVVYTASAAAVSGGNIDGHTQLGIDLTNTSYLNSGINAQLVRVSYAQVDYNENNRTFGDHIAALQGTSDGIMDIVHTWRNQFVADIVVLFVNDQELCGQASVILANASTAFAVVDAQCPSGTYVFAHELGHLQGARHDRFVDPTNTPFQYGHGYVDPNHQWRTIMSYVNACAPVNCAPVQYWSSPNVIYPPTGQVMGTAAFEDDARVLNETRARTASYSPAITVGINGPTRIPAEGDYTWNATVSAGGEPYTYVWMRQNTSGFTDPFEVGNGGPSLTMFLSASNKTAFFVWAVVTGSRGALAESTHLWVSWTTCPFGC